jgi:ABC-type transport system involved in cytochrome bd biosynthesis fused ATPase/permease subunit
MASKELQIFINALEEHSRREIEGRNAYRKELTEEVKGMIKLTVNGKIDRLTENVELTDRKLVDFIKESQPVIDAFKEDQTVNKALSRKAKKILFWLGGIVTVFGALYFLVPFIKDVAQYFTK